MGHLESIISITFTNIWRPWSNLWPLWTPKMAAEALKIDLNSPILSNNFIYIENSRSDSENHYP